MFLGRWKEKETKLTASQVFFFLFFFFFLFCCTWLEKEDFLENLHILSHFVQLKCVLLISCVFWIFFFFLFFFQNAVSQLCFSYSQKFGLKKLSKLHDLRLSGRLFQKRAPERATVVLNRSILGLGNLLLLECEWGDVHRLDVYTGALFLRALYISNTLVVVSQSHSGELRTQKLKSHLLGTQSSKVLLFNSLSRSVYSHTCYAYFQGFLLCLFIPFRSIHLHFPKSSPDFFLLCWLLLSPIPM